MGNSFKRLSEIKDDGFAEFALMKDIEEYNEYLKFMKDLNHEIRVKTFEEKYGYSVSIFSNGDIGITINNNEETK